MNHQARQPEIDLPALLRAAGDGNESAWREVVGLYSRRVYGLAKSRCGRHDIAEEITQSVFVTLATKLTRGATSGYQEQDKFEPWLFRIAMNRIRDEMRRLRRHAEPTDPESFGRRAAPPDDQEERGAAAGELDRLREAMAELSEADRDIIELRHHGGMSFKQIAELLDEPIGTLLARHHRALKKLKTIMEDAGGAATAAEAAHRRGGTA